MTDWSGALERAFAAHLQNRGSGGSRGSSALRPSVSAELRGGSPGTPAINEGVPGVPERRLGTPGTPEYRPEVLGSRPPEQQAIQALAVHGTPGTPRTSSSDGASQVLDQTSPEPNAPVLRAQPEWVEGVSLLARASPLPAYSAREWD